jgi:hypothetical protein
MPAPTPPPDPHRPQIGDPIRFENDLTVGDLCYFDRDWNGVWLVKRLDDLSEWTYDRPLLTLTPGDEPNSGKLRVVTEEELHSLFGPHHP